MLGIPRLVENATYPGYVFQDAPRNVYWETTISCDLACQHCRADAIAERDPLELSTEEGKALLRDIKQMGSMLILTGGDPLKRPDLLELVEYAHEIKLPTGITPSTTPLLQRETVKRFRELGVAALGVSLDGPWASASMGPTRPCTTSSAASRGRSVTRRTRCRGLGSSACRCR